MPSMRLLFLLLTLTALATADIRLPPPIEKSANMRIVHDAVGKDGPVLDIPASLADTSTRADVLPNPQFDGGGGGRSLYEIVSGFFLSIGAFFTGRAFWRKSRGPQKALVPFAIVAGSFLLWTGSTQAQRPATIANAAPTGNLEGKVKVRILRRGSEVVLHLPPVK